MNGLQRIPFLPLKRAASLPEAGSGASGGEKACKKRIGAFPKSVQAALRTGKRLPEKAA
ncbi:MAG: hypothetical protein ACTTKK_01465 [Ottowia sp.]